MHSLKIPFILAGIFISVLFYGCSKNVVAPSSDKQSDQLSKSSVVESDMDVLNNEGIPMRNCDGLFALGWNELFGPIRWNDEINGHAMAIVFGDSLHPAA